MKTFAALPIALLLTLSPTLAGPSAADEASGPVGVARGTFGHPGHEPLAVVDAFAWEAGRSLGEGNAIHVRLSGESLDHAALDGAIDFEMELERQRARAPYAELEIDPRDLTWLGSSFSLPDGWGCAWCRIGRPKTRLRLEDGRVRGRLDVEAVDGPDGDGVDIALSLDVPIARLEGLIPLPAGGGEPASALELCRASVLSGDREAARAHCLSPDDPQAGRRDPTCPG